MTNPEHPIRGDYSRREALRLMGTAAGAGLAAAAGGIPARAQQTFTSVAAPDFPEGAIIRTLQGDVAPEALADGATLFHEHVGRGDVDLAVEELRACAFDGLGCIVDAATGRRTPEQVSHLNAVAEQSEVRIVMAGGYFEDIGFAIYPVRVRRDVRGRAGRGNSSRTPRPSAGAPSARSRRRSRCARTSARCTERVARAHLRTGIPIFTHTPHESCPTCAMEQMDVIEGRGRRPLPRGRRPYGHHQARARPAPRRTARWRAARVHRARHPRARDGPVGHPRRRQGADGAGPHRGGADRPHPALVRPGQRPPVQAVLRPRLVVGADAVRAQAPLCRGPRRGDSPDSRRQPRRFLAFVPVQEG